MKQFRAMTLPSLLALATAAALGAPAQAVDVQATAGQATAGQATAGPGTQSVQWKIWGGEASFRWNRDLMGDLGIVVSPAKGGSKADMYGWEGFQVSDAAALDLAIHEGSFGGFIGGALGLRGGFDLQIGKSRIDLRNLRLLPREHEPFILDVVGSDGEAWFYIDRIMYVVVGEKAPALAIRAADLRIAPALAERLNNPLAAHLAVADMTMHTRIHAEGGDAALLLAQAPKAGRKWPGTPVPNVEGAVYEVDVLMHHMTAQFIRKSADASGPAGSGKVVFTPSSTLRNNRNNGTAIPVFPTLPPPPHTVGPFSASDPMGTSSALYAADVVWNDRKRHPQTPPYDNDQHPYLIWNLYRIDPDGQITQIGRSGVKHAFLTTNNPCDEYPGTGYILGRGCVDTYGTGNNDNTLDLGPRSEIIPATGQWGRCGSLFDANCDGAGDYGHPCSNAPNIPNCSSWGFRMQVDERDISDIVHPGAEYWFESWYIVRDDIDIYNTMQTRPVQFVWANNMWNVNNGLNTNQRFGPAIDRWLARETDTATERSSDIATEHGQGRLAVKVTELEDGLWRYDYVLANFDYAVAKTSGSEPNLRVLSNTGFIGFEVEAGAGTPDVTADAFFDVDLDEANDWSFEQQGHVLRWQPEQRTQATGSNNLDWGNLFRFSIQTTAAPVPGVARVKAPDDIEIEVPTLVPEGQPLEPEIFDDGFEEAEEPVGG